MAWKRVIELDIGPGTQGLRVSALDLTFQVIRSNELTNNEALFTIYNAQKDTRDKILKKGNNLVFRAGYEDENNVSPIFIGTITYSNSFRDGPDWVTDIRADDIYANDKKLTYDNIVDFSYKSGTPLSNILQDTAAVLSVPILGLENVTTKLNNGFVYSGPIGKMLRDFAKLLKNEEVGLYFDSSEMVLYKIGEKQESVFGITRITETSGLIGTVEEITEEEKEDDRKRIALTSLLRPELKPNMVINVQKGVYIIEKFEHVGDTFGGDFLSHIEAVE